MTAEVSERKAMFGEYVCLPSWLVSAWKRMHSLPVDEGGQQLFPELTSDEGDAFLLLMQEVQKQLVSGNTRPTLSRNHFLRNFSASRESQRRHGTRLFDFLLSFGLREHKKFKQLFSGQVSFAPDEDCFLELCPSLVAQENLLGFVDALRQTSDRIALSVPLIPATTDQPEKNWYISRILWGDLSARERILFCLFSDYIQSGDFYVQWDGVQTAPINLIFERSGMGARDFLKACRLISLKMQDHGHLASSFDLQFPFYPSIEGEIGSFLKLHGEHSRAHIESGYREGLAGFLNDRRSAELVGEGLLSVEKTFEFMAVYYHVDSFVDVYKKSLSVFDCKELIELPQVDRGRRMLLCHPVDLAVEMLARYSGKSSDASGGKSFALASEFDLGSADSVCRFAQLLESLAQKDPQRLTDMLPKDLWLSGEWTPEMIKSVRDGGRPRSVQKKDPAPQERHQDAVSKRGKPKFASEQETKQTPASPQKAVTERAGADGSKRHPALSHASMVGKARRELGGLRRNDYQHYEKLRQTYLDSLDASTLEIVKEMQKRLPRDLFDDQLGDRISRFMVENPHLWKTRIKPASYGQ